MSSATFFCHPAGLYHFLEEHIIEKGIEGLYVNELPVNKENDRQLAMYIVGRICNTPPPHHTEITLRGDEELLCWIKMTFNPKTFIPQG